MFERGIGYGHNQFVRRLAVCFNNNGAILTFGRIEQRPEPLERDLLVPKINRRDRTAGDADDLLVLLRAEQEWRGRRRDRDPRLQNKVRTQEQEENEEKHHVDEWEHDQPAEIIFLGPTQLHPLIIYLGDSFATANPSLWIDLAIAMRFSRTAQCFG